MQERLVEGATPKDREGTYYAYVIKGSEDENGMPLVKIGRTYRNPPEVRPEEQAARNGERGQYDLICVVQVDDHKMAESVVHKMCKNAREERTTLRADGKPMDGRTETFRMDPKQAKMVLESVKAEVDILKASSPPAEAQAARDKAEAERYAGDQVRKKYKHSDGSHTDKW